MSSQYQPPQNQPQYQPQVQTQIQPQPQDVSRRTLMRGGLVGGALGVVIAGGAGAAVALTGSESLKPASKPVVMAPMEANATNGPLAFYISDSSSGVIDVFAGTGATQIHNPGLVKQLMDNLK